MKKQNIVNYHNGQQFAKSVKKSEIHLHEEVGDLKGYQYLTNNLLLTLNGNLVKDINTLMRRIDKLEKVAGIDLSDTNLEVYWWYEKMNEIENRISKNGKQIRDLVQENWVIKNEMKNVSEVKDNESMIKKEIAEIVKDLMKENITTERNNETRFKKLQTDSVEIINNFNSLSESMNELKSNNEKLDNTERLLSKPYNTDENRTQGNDTKEGNSDSSLRNVSEELIEVKSQLNIMKNVIKEIKEDIEFFHTTQDCKEQIIITHDNGSLENAIDSFCQFADQINDKVSEISKTVLSNEHKINCLDNKINNFANVCTKNNDFELSNENKRQVATETLKKESNKSKLETTSCHELTSRALIDHKTDIQLNDFNHNKAFMDASKSIRQYNGDHLLGHDESLYSSDDSFESNNPSKSRATWNDCTSLQTKNLGCGTVRLMNKKMNCRNWENSKNLRKDVTKASIVRFLIDTCSRNASSIDDLYETQHTHELELLNLNLKNSSIHEKIANTSKHISTKEKEGTIIDNRNARYIDVINKRKSNKNECNCNILENNLMLNSKFQESDSIFIGDGNMNSFEKKEVVELRTKMNILDDIIKNLPKNVEMAVKHELKKKIFNNLSRLDSKIDKLDGKVNRLTKSSSANLKVKLDAVNVKKNSCLSKWDKFEIDLGVEKLQKTTFVIHQKKSLKM